MRVGTLNSVPGMSTAHVVRRKLTLVVVNSFFRKSKAYLASCRGIGSSLGLIIVFPSFLNLESTYFANLFRSVPGDTGLVDFTGEHDSSYAKQTSSVCRKFSFA